MNLNQDGKDLHLPLSLCLFRKTTYSTVPMKFVIWLYRGADKSLVRPTSRCILFDGENISFDVSLVIYIKIVLIFLQL